MFAEHSPVTCMSSEIGHENCLLSNTLVTTRLSKQNCVYFIMVAMWGSEPHWGGRCRLWAGCALLFQTSFFDFSSITIHEATCCYYVVSFCILMSWTVVCLCSSVVCCGVQHSSDFCKCSIISVILYCILI